ncbi:MAG: metallophosphoesterase family protein [Chlamydiae bacterium]|nr:metallophosphoesterase family protein [Chlamydiota bacterium]
MRVILKNFFLFIILGFIFLQFSSFQEREIIYLSYVSDPTCSITIQWWVPNNKKLAESITYRKKGEDRWVDFSATSKVALNIPYEIFRADLTDLKPDTEYEFLVKDFSKVYSFKTLPDSLSKGNLKVGIGGDIYSLEQNFVKMNRCISDKNLDFVILGGDITYDLYLPSFFKDKHRQEKRWLSFFQHWSDSMTDPKGRKIPLVPVVGNHDVPKGRKNPHTHDISFYKVFAFPEKNKSYRSLDIGSYLAVFLLDTGHTFPIKGEQTTWLKQALAQRKDYPFKIAVYHISAYPSVYKYSKWLPREIRRYWCPLFEEGGLQVAFEHHNHAYKKTYPITNEKIDLVNGVIYVGDGCWGVKPRKTHSSAWYLEKKEQQTCFNVLSLSEKLSEIEVYNAEGRLIDNIKMPERRPKM